MEYKPETESSIESVLSAQEQLPPTLPPVLSSPSLPNTPSPPPPYTMSQHDVNLEQVVRQQQEQLAVLQAIIAQTGLGGTERAAAFVRPNIQVEVARPQEFDGSSRKMARFIIVCKLYIHMKMRGVAVEKQIQWVLSYVQGGSADTWKENMLEDLECYESRLKGLS